MSEVTGRALYGFAQACTTTVCVLALSNCSPAETGTEGAEPRTEAASEGADSVRAAEFVAAAESVVGFLRGSVAFETLHIADSVTLYLSPEGGVGRVTRSRAALADRRAWHVRSETGRTYSLVPAAAMTRLTTRFGRHFNCHETDLASRVPELARLPHVGARLEPEQATSCLQTWNLTLVFAADDRPPRLIAAVHDQWEW